MSVMKTNCPNCGAEIKLEDTIAAPLLAAKEQQHQTQLKAEREKAEQAAMAKATAKSAELLDAQTKKLAEMETLMAERAKKLKAAQEKEAQFLAKERALEDQQRELNLTIEKKVSAAQQEIFKKAQLEAGEAQALKLKEKDEQLASMAKKIEELQKKSAQGSQQLQGEALELHLEDILAAKFPTDRIDPVGKGVNGADLQQFVIARSGEVAGSILWESKRTKNWSNDWPAKLKADQRAAGAEIGILVSEARPDGIDSFEFHEGIYVAAPRYVLPLALVTRQMLLGVAKSRANQSGQKEKSALVYEYLTGSQFRHRVEAICEHFNAMQDELQKERAAMQRLWAKREKQIQGVIDNTVGLYGDLEGIAGRAMPQIDGLSIDLLALEEEVEGES